jgi:hypothetical protein
MKTYSPTTWVRCNKNAKRIITALVKNEWRLPQGFHL